MYRRFHRWLTCRYMSESRERAEWDIKINRFDPFFWLWLMLPVPGSKRYRL